MKCFNDGETENPTIVHHNIRGYTRWYIYMHSFLNIYYM